MLLLRTPFNFIDRDAQSNRFSRPRPLGFTSRVHLTCVSAPPIPRAGSCTFVVASCQSTQLRRKPPSSVGARAPTVCTAHRTPPDLTALQSNPVAPRRSPPDTNHHTPPHPPHPHGAQIVGRHSTPGQPAPPVPRHAIGASGQTLSTPSSKPPLVPNLLRLFGTRTTHHPSAS